MAIILYRGIFEEAKVLTTFHVSQSVRRVLIGLLRLEDFGAKLIPVACHPQPEDTKLINKTLRQLTQI